MATAGRDQDNGRVAALLFGVCRTSLQCAFEIGEGGQSMTIEMRVQERQEMDLACVIFALLGLHV